MNNEDSMAVVLREMDYQKLTEIRARAKTNGGPTIGNEHAAVTRLITENLLMSSVFELANLLNTELPLPMVIVDGSASELKTPRQIS